MSDLFAELKDDMFVLETPSFTLPFLFEKPPQESIRTFTDKLGEALGEPREETTSAPVEKFLSKIGESLVQEFALREIVADQTKITRELVGIKNKPYHLKLKKCKQCSFRTDSGFTMLRHMNTVTPRGSSYHCHYCGLEALSTTEMVSHLEVKHNAAAEFEPAPATHQCPNCPFEGTIKRNVYRHGLNCQKKFHLETNLQVEWEPPAILKSQGPTVVCEICNVVMADQFRLWYHLATSHKVRVHPRMFYNGSLLSCQKCGGRFLTDEGLERHMLGYHGLMTSYVLGLVHKGSDSGTCVHCGKFLLSGMLIHLQNEHSLTIKFDPLCYKCKVCDVSFPRYRLFESHVYSVHGTRKKKAA